MSVHLVGGGWSADAAPAVYGAFLDEAAAVAARRGHELPRVVVVAVRDGDADEHAAGLVAGLRAAGELEPVVVAVAEAEATAEAALDGHEGAAAVLAGLLDAELETADGVVVGGGLTPAYLAALRPHADALRALVAADVPYLGLSAGAAVAAERALVGGWRIGGVAVGDEGASEDLDEVTVTQGIGLLDVTVDVHAAQWGTLTRLIAATEAGLVAGGVAVDEDTVLVVGAAGLAVAGAGNVWRVVPGDAGVVVGTLAHG